MCQWIRSALVHIMACRLFGARPLSKPILVIVNWTLRNKLNSNFNQNTKLFIHKDASENITCEMVAILSRERWGNGLSSNTSISYAPSVVLSDQCIGSIDGWYIPFHNSSELSKSYCKLHVLVILSSLVQNLVTWLPIKVAHTCKLDTIWVVYCLPIGNDSILF